MKKTVENEIFVCDVCDKEEALDLAIRDCAICKKHVYEDDAFLLSDRNGLWPLPKLWICRNHIKEEKWKDV